MELTKNGKSAFVGTFGQCIAFARSERAFPYELGGSIIESLPPEAPRAARKPARAKVKLVTRTDADAAYQLTGRVLAAKVWVDTTDPAGKATWIKAKGGAVYTRLTFAFEEASQCESSEPARVAANVSTTTPAPAKPAQPSMSISSAQPAGTTGQAVTSKTSGTKGKKMGAKKYNTKPALTEVAFVAPPKEKKAKKKPAPTTREEWLMRMTREHFADLFAKHGAEIPAKLRVSCGWPSSRALGGKKRIIGQCWHPGASGDGSHEIFVSPVLSDISDVAGTLAHELAHACLPADEGHGKAFGELARGVGLEGKLTQCGPGEWLKDWIAKAAAEVGPYPHATLDQSQRKKQTTRLLKVACTEPDCPFYIENEKPYSVRMSASVYEAGAPICGCCRSVMLTEEDINGETEGEE